MTKQTELYCAATKIRNRSASAFYLMGTDPIPVNMPAPGHDVVGLQAYAFFSDSSALGERAERVSPSSSHTCDRSGL
ncbi:hypothetical protein RA280_33630 [Cupriavidus sp. CV2]|nr:hypothetical protein [Cupriavidus sp. CV2]